MIITAKHTYSTFKSLTQCKRWYLIIKSWWWWSFQHQVNIKDDTFERALLASTMDYFVLFKWWYLIKILMMKSLLLNLDDYEVFNIKDDTFGRTLLATMDYIVLLSKWWYLIIKILMMMKSLQLNLDEVFNIKSTSKIILWENFISYNGLYCLTYLSPVNATDILNKSLHEVQSTQNSLQWRTLSR